MVINGLGAGGHVVSDDPLKHTAQIEIVCPRCGYRMVRTAARLRRETEILCPSCGGPVAPGADERDDRRSRARDDK